VIDASTPPHEEAEQQFTEDHRASGSFWDKVRADAAAIIPRSAWWNDPPTLRHINRIVCGEPVDGAHVGFTRRLGQMLQSQGIAKPRAISVGSGSGGKELAVLRSGAVYSFDCYEVSSNAVESGRGMAAQQGVSDRLFFHNMSPFSGEVGTEYDVVYWNNALHHMSDTVAAVEWSRSRLRAGGVFAMDDYVGASRFQHTSELIEWARRIRALLPDRLLRTSADPNILIPRDVPLHDPVAIAAADPTEAVDSGNILKGIRRTFQAPEIIPTGGAAYFIALHDAFHNFEGDDDSRLLDALLLMDEALAQFCESPYAVAFAVKQE
jgi:hypothetical protein